MRIDLLLERTMDQPKCIGCGFVALDVVEGEEGEFATAGGSCGNVMAILSWLGWGAHLVARLGNDRAGELVVDELSKSGVDVSAVVQDGGITTPVVIQKFVMQSKIGRIHRFSISCPECGAWLPRYRATTIRQVEPVMDSADVPLSFYFDRVTPSALRLAAWAAAGGALIVFEPSSIGDEGMFRARWSYAMCSNTRKSSLDIFPTWLLLVNRSL